MHICLHIYLWRSEKVWTLDSWQDMVLTTVRVRVAEPLARSDEVREKHLHPSVKRFVYRAGGACVDVAQTHPKVQVRSAMGGRYKLVQCRQESLQPPIKIVFFQLLRFAPDLLPVGRCACECDAREPAATTHAVGEVMLNRVHQTDVAHDFFHGTSRAEVVLQKLRGARQRVGFDQSRELRENTGPVIVWRAFHESWPLDFQLLLALVFDEQVPEFLSILINMVR